MRKKFKLIIASGKGGVGKSMLASSLAMLFAKEKNKKIVAVDCDVDAPNLDIWLGSIKKWDKIIPAVTSARPEIDYNKCNGCGLCVKNCRFSAMEMTRAKLTENCSPLTRPVLNPFLCEGCGACEVICPKKAIKLKPVQNGQIRTKRIYPVRKKSSNGARYNFPLVSGQLFPGETGSGKIVTEIRKEADKFEYNLMIMDSSPGTGCPVIASLQGSDLAILITEPTPSGFSDLKRGLTVVKHFKIPWKLVINKWDINPKLSKKIEKWADKKFLGKISYDKNIFKAVSNLTPIMKTNLRAKTEIKKIFEKLKAENRYI